MNTNLKTIAFLSAFLLFNSTVIAEMCKQQPVSKEVGITVAEIGASTWWNYPGGGPFTYKNAYEFSVKALDDGNSVFNPGRTAWDYTGLSPVEQNGKVLEGPFPLGELRILYQAAQWAPYGSYFTGHYNEVSEGYYRVHGEYNIPVDYKCADDYQFNVATLMCEKEVPEGQVCVSKNAGQTCEESLFHGNPINIAIGNKYQRENDYRAIGIFPLSVSRSYNSVTNSWRYLPELKIVTTNSRVYMVRADGKALTYWKESNAWVSDPDIVSTLTASYDSQGIITGWTYITANDQTETYDAQGRILSVTERNGLSHTYSYQTNSITVTHASGDTLVYQLESEGRVSSFTDPDNRTYLYSYDTQGRLISITFPDDTPADATDNLQRIYHYENSIYPHALTGITDENGNRYATWAYDDQGRAISSEHAGGLDRTTLTYNADETTTVTSPLGKQTTYHFITIEGVKKVTQVEGHPTASCEGANKAYTYNANGFMSSKTDWKGSTTTYTRDDRGLVLSRTEAVGTPQERTITTEWHPDFRLSTKITEPGKIIEYTYDAQGRELSRSVQSAQ